MRATLRLSVAFLLLVALMCATRSTSATAGEDTGWTITSFHAAIDIQRDGTLHITEKITVDFAELERHGIFREIPIEYAIDGDDEHNRRYEFDLVSVTDSTGNEWPAQVSRAGANVRVRIGDPDRTVTGVQTYLITYEVGRALNSFSSHDELYWNVNGFDWPVPILASTAVVELEDGGLGDSACYQGPRGSSDPCTHTRNEADTAILYAATGSFPPGEQMTIVAAIGKGIISPEPTPLLVDKPQNWWERNFPPSPAAIATSAALLIVGVAGLGALWWRHGRDRVYRSIYYLSRNPEEQTRPLFYKDQVVVEYAPPDDLRPAQLGLILDERADTKDVTATIIDLAVRGYITIEEKEKTWLFGSKDWRLTRKKDADESLLPFESKVMQGLFEDAATEVDLSDLKNKFYDDLAEAQKRLYEDSVRRAWFASSPDSRRDIWRIIGIGMAAAGAGLGWLLGMVGAAIVGLPLIVLGALVFIGGHSLMSKRTAAGSEALRRALGFRLFIETADKRRQEFSERANIFAEYLPYAIVFGSVEKWANAFRDIDTAPSMQTWYAGTSAFVASDFSRSLESFSSSVSNVIASTPGSSGSSGFGGGGSGGGGGGGGGGSW